MTIQNAQPVPELIRIRDEIDRLGLHRYVAELDATGLTVIPPDAAAGGDLVDRAFAKILDLCEQRTGVRPDVATGGTHSGKYFLPVLHYVLFKDRVFEELLMNPVAVAILTYLLGESCVLNATGVFMKGPSEPRADGRLQLDLHSDMTLHPPPFPQFAQHCNVTWLLSDYSEENGGLAYVPGSHLYCRHPNPGEGLDEAVPVTAPKGSLVIWHGNTWHGSYAKVTPGLRTGLSLEFCRMYLLTAEPYRDSVPAEVLARNPARFATFMGQHLPFGWKDEGPDPKKVYATFSRTLWH